MPKNKNFGGSGGQDSTQFFYLKGKSKYYNPENQNYKLKPDELEKYFLGREIECLQCGRWYKNISSHLYHSHRMTKDNYCELHHIPVGTALIASESSNKMSDSGKKKIEKMDLEEKKKIFSYLDKYRHSSLKEIVMAECIKCFKKFEKKGYKRGSQCPECFKKARIEAVNKCTEKNKHEEKLLCDFCKEEFITTNPKLQRKNKSNLAVYCSLSCASKFGNPKKFYTKKCIECGNEFIRKKDRNKFCSRKCYSKSDLTKIISSANGVKGWETRKDSTVRDEEGKFKKQ